MESFLGNFYGLLAIFSGHTAVVVVQIVNFFTYATLSDAIFCLLVILQSVGGSPGLEVKEGDSCCEGCGFESGWTFFHINCKICIDVCLQKTKKGRKLPIFEFCSHTIMLTFVH